MIGRADKDSTKRTQSSEDHYSPSLPDWQRSVLPELRQMSFPKAGTNKVTLLAYFYWDDERFETRFWEMECAFLCAWKSLGALPAIIVANRMGSALRSFAERFGVDVQIEPSLTGDGTEAMSLDCILALHRRFPTEYVLIIQTDGFPLTSGIERFLGRYDYFGAPWPGHMSWTDFYPYPRFGVGNGGFSLRSKRICEAASEAYRCFWRRIPIINQPIEEDVFFCKVLPFFSRRWRREFRFPSIAEAIQFSIESIPPGIRIDRPPLGFHSPGGFQQYVERFGVPFAELL